MEVVAYNVGSWVDCKPINESVTGVFMVYCPVLLLTSTQREIWRDFFHVRLSLQNVYIPYRLRQVKIHRNQTVKIMSFLSFYESHPISESFSVLTNEWKMSDLYSGERERERRGHLQMCSASFSHQSHC